MNRKLAAGFALLSLHAVTQSACAPSAVPAAAPTTAASGPGVVHVAPPTGAREADRASILAALEQVEPGGTVQFAAGTYLIGEFIDVPVPRVTLEGHAEGTALRGCEPAVFAAMDVAIAECNGLNLTGGHQTVRGLTFEYTWHALSLGGLRCTAGACKADDPPVRERVGGYRVEGNTFRESQNGVRVSGQWAEPAVIRGNRFINTYHAVMIESMTAHVLDNDITVPEPGRVPYTHHPGLALGIGGWADREVPKCDGNIIAGNRISGHPDAIAILVFPGGSCRHNEIRDNVIEMATVRFASPSTALHVRSEADSTVAGVAIALLNGRFGDGVMEENRVEGNRISGSAGVAVELVGASRNRIAGNTISGVTRREPFPGNTLFSFVPGWAGANGSGIWISPGSSENEVVGNTFENVASHAAVIEGDRNRVERRSDSDGVHDLGTGNRVEAARYQSGFVEARGIRLHYLDFGGTGLPLVFVHDWYEDAHTWSTMAPPFAAEHRVLAMTRRGYGQSGDVGWGYDVATQAEDILGFLDALGMEQAVLVGRHPTTQDMTWIAEHHPQRLAGLVYLHHALWPSPGDLRMLRDRTFAEMFFRFGGCWMGEEAYERSAPRLVYRPHYIDDVYRRIDVPALSFTHPGDFAAGIGTTDLLDLTLEIAMSTDPGGGFCDADAIVAPVAWLAELAGDAERLAAARALIPTSAERRGYAEAFERAFGSNLRVVHLDAPANYRTDPDIYQPHMRSFLADLVAARDHPTQRSP
jgi:parallel beta-helix repeat protein